MKIQVCTGKTCKSRFSEYITKRLNGEIEKHKLGNIILEEVPCMGHCKIGPNVSIDGKIEHDCDPTKVAKIMMDRKLKEKN